MGAKLGLLAGGLGFGLLALLSTFRLFAASERTELRNAFREKMQEAAAAAADPDVRQAMEQFRGYIATDHGLIIVVLFFLAIAAMFFLLFSALGGALGAALFGRESGQQTNRSHEHRVLAARLQGRVSSGSYERHLTAASSS